MAKSSGNGKLWENDGRCMKILEHMENMGEHIGKIQGTIWEHIWEKPSTKQEVKLEKLGISCDFVLVKKCDFWKNQAITLVSWES